MIVNDEGVFLECGAYSRRFPDLASLQPSGLFARLVKKRREYAPHSKAWWLFFCCWAITSGSLLADDPKRDDASEIQKVIQAQQAAWNRGDIEGFMGGYWRSEKTVFVSGDEVTRGWQKVLDRYKAKYSDHAKMGTLTFSEIEITPLSGDSAIALGSWKLNRATDSPHGKFTLIFRHFPDGWKIVHDHTSVAERPR